MGIFDKEEIIAPTIEAAIATVVAPAVTPKESKATLECTRGEGPCPVKNCENCA